MKNIALLGAGRIGQIHAKNTAQRSDLRLTHVVDPFPAAAESISAKWGAKTCSIEEVLEDKSVDGIIIASATETHLEYMRRSVEAGKIVFCEKPVDQDLARAKASAKDLSKGKILMGFNRRFDPNFQALETRLADGAIGKLESLHIISNDPSPPPIEYITGSGGIFKDMTIHDFDMARWLLKEEPVEVYATGSCQVDPAIAEAGDIDTACTVLKTGSGQLCVINNSRRSGFGYDQRVEAFASKGMAHVENMKETSVQVWNEQGSYSDKFQNFFLDRYAAAYVNEMEHFAHVLNGEAPLVAFSDGLAALALAEAATESLRSGRVIRMT